MSKELELEPRATPVSTEREAPAPGSAVPAAAGNGQTPASFLPAESFWTGRARLVAFPIVFAFCLWLTGSFFDDYWNSIAISGAVVILGAMGLFVLLEWSGQISLAQIGLVGTGAFTTAQLNDSWSLFGSAVGGVAAATLLSLIIGIPALRIRGFELAILTLAAGAAIDQWLFKTKWLIGDTGLAGITDLNFLRIDLGPIFFEGFDVATVSGGAQVGVVIVCCAVMLTTTIGSSAIGRALRMVAADEGAAAAYGINVGIHKLFAFVYCGFCAGLAGVVFALTQVSMQSSAFPAQSSILYVSVVVVAGAGPVWGVVQLALFFAAIPILLGSLLQQYLLLFFGSLLLFVIRFDRGGMNVALKKQGKGLSLLYRLIRSRITGQPFQRPQRPGKVAS